MVWSVTGASWTYWTWMSLPWRGEPSTPPAVGSEEATAISWAPCSTWTDKADHGQHGARASAIRLRPHEPREAAEAHPPHCGVHRANVHSMTELFCCIPK